MHSLETIRRLNKEAVAKSDENLRANGGWPVDNGGRIPPHGDPMRQSDAPSERVYDLEVVDDARRRGHRLERLEDAAQQVMDAWRKGQFLGLTEAIRDLDIVLMED